MGSNREPPAPWPDPLTAKELVIGVVATLLFFLAAMTVPVFGILAGVFTPLPTLLAYYRWGSPGAFWVPGGAGVLGGGLLASLNLLQGFPLLVELLLLGLLLGWGMRRNYTPERTVIIAGACVFALGVLVFWATYGGGGEGPGSQMEQDLRDAIGLVLLQYGAVAPDQQAIEETIQQMLPFLVQLLPGAALSSLLMACWLNLLAARRFCRVRQLPLPAWGEWSRWRAPDSMVWIVIASGLVFLLPFSALKVSGLNALLVAGVVYLFQGLAIVSFYFEKWNLPRMVRALLYAIILIQQVFTLGTMLMGLFDMWVDFRRLSRSPTASV